MKRKCQPIAIVILNLLVQLQIYYTSKVKKLHGFVKYFFDAFCEYVLSQKEYIIDYHTEHCTPIS